MSAALPSIQLPVDYNNLFNEIGDFLVTFKQDTLSAQAPQHDDEDENMDAENIEQDLLEKGPKYMAMLQKVANRELTSVVVELDDICSSRTKSFCRAHKRTISCLSSSKTPVTSPNYSAGPLTITCPCQQRKSTTGTTFLMLSSTKED